MTSKNRVDKLEKMINPVPGRVYVIIDRQGKHWVNGVAMTEYEFNKEFTNERIEKVRVGFDISKV